MTHRSKAAGLPKDVQEFTQPDYVMLGLLIAGGARTWVDAEDVAVVCFKLNRVAFRWTKYDYPRLEAVLIAFRRLKKQYGQDIIIAPTAQSTERRLTALGLKRALALGELFLGRSYATTASLVAALRRRLGVADKPSPVDLPEPQSPVQGADAREALSFITNHAAYRAWERGALQRLPLWQIADVLQCLPDSPATVWRERLARYQSLAAWWNRTDAVEFLEAVAGRLDEPMRT